MGVQGVGETLMIAGGGTGGHIYPAIAIAQEWMARDATRRVVFVGTERGLEKTIVPKAGFPLEFISVGGLKGKGLGDTIEEPLPAAARFRAGVQARRQASSERRPRRRRLLLGAGAARGEAARRADARSTNRTPSPA